MKEARRKNNIVFAVYPNAKGFGFVYMGSPRKLIDYGAIKIYPVSNWKVMERVKQSIDYYRPSIVVVQNPEGKSSRTGSRVKQLVKRVVKYAVEQKLSVVRYSRDQIRDVFEQFGAVTKYEISQLLITEFKELEPKSPRKRSLWTSEDRNMAIFDALSLAMTWFYLND
jgi:hypothetical protein